MPLENFAAAFGRFQFLRLLFEKILNAAAKLPRSTSMPKSSSHQPILPTLKTEQDQTGLGGWGRSFGVEGSAVVVEGVLFRF